MSQNKSIMTKYGKKQKCKDLKIGFTFFFLKKIILEHQSTFFFFFFWLLKALIIFYNKLFMINSNL